MAKKTFNVECTMDERWIDDFCSFLRQMEFMGKIGHSANMAFFVDGDGDFNPRFGIDTDFIHTEPKETFTTIEVDAIYDAG